MDGKPAATVFLRSGSGGLEGLVELGSVRGRNKGLAGQAEARAWGSRSMMTAGWSACWKATAVLTVSAVLPASPFWEMKASVCMHVRMQEARATVS